MICTIFVAETPRTETMEHWNKRRQMIADDYGRRCAEAEAKVRKCRKEIGYISLMRLLVFCGGVAGIVACRQEGWPLIVMVAAAALLLFVGLVKRHTKLYGKKAYIETEMRVNREELKALEHDTADFDNGEEFMDPAHYYTYDLDIFGDNSLFQYLNRTCTTPGRRCLATWLTRHLTDAERIKERQEAVRELKECLEFRQKFRILGLLHRGETADEAELKQWATQPAVFRKHLLMRLLPPIVTLGNAAGVLMMLLGVLPGTLYGAMWTTVVAFSFIFTAKVSRQQAMYGKKLRILSTYAALLQHMEGQPLESGLLQRIKRRIGGERQGASQAIHRLNRLMHELDQRNNLFMYAVLNGFFFWEVGQMMKIEKWKAQYAGMLPAWLEAIGEMDALCSLGTFAYNLPDASFPLLTSRSAGTDSRLSGTTSRYSSAASCAGDVAGTMGEEAARVMGETSNAIGEASTPSSSVSEEEDITAGGEGKFCFRAHGLAHPLMPEERCVRNDIDMHRSTGFIIVTGANMAGKSTYLRTVGVNFLLACIGAPVCAHDMTLTPVQLITSLRTSDSLAGNESYFFAELKRLKLIIDLLQEGYELFIILDEILKGTNSIDKQRGSMALVEQFLQLHTHGIIATHDLLLGTLIDTFPQAIRNFCFEADIRDNELTFSYRMRPGVAQNMNACFLMQRMGIAVTDHPHANAAPTEG
ncbi:MAG: hypothetical protein IJ511_09310 [Bacteroides sp.]|nr:hypothetical protein [Bacteroides sp.]